MSSSSDTRTRRRLAGAAAILMSSFVASRLVGLGRDMAISYEFGTTPELAAYLAAFRLPDFLFQVLAGAALASAFVPTFTRFQAAGDERGAWTLTSSLLNLVGLTTLVLSVAAIIAAPWIIPALVYGFDPAYQEITVRLTRIMLATPVLFGISGIIGSALNARQHFLLPAVAPIVYNLCIIAGALFLSPYVGVEGLAWGVTAGAFLHLLVQVPGLFREGMVYRLVVSVLHPGVKEVARLMGPRMLGLGAVHVNFVVTTSLASTLAPFSLPALNYGWLLMLLPLGVFGVAISSAVFPTMAEQAATDTGASMVPTLYSTLRMILFLTIPATVGLIALGQPLVALVFQRGKFDEISAQATYVALVFYAVGLFAHGMIEILARAFYAAQHTRTPVIFVSAAMGLNIVLSYALIGPMGHGGLALSVSLAAVFEAFLLLHAIRGFLRPARPLPIVGSAIRTCAAAGVMAAAIATFRLLVPVPAGSVGLGLYVIAGVASGAGVFFAAALAFGSAEAKSVLRGAAVRP